MISKNNWNNKKTKNLMSMDNFKSKKLGIVLITASLMSSVSTSAYADITNSANASGTYDDGTVNGQPVTTTTPGTASVPVTAPVRDLKLAISVVNDSATVANGSDVSVTDVGDKIIYEYTFTNDGNIKEYDVKLASGDVPDFNTVEGSGTFETWTKVDGSAAPTSLDVPFGGTVTVRRAYVLSMDDLRYAADITNAVSYSTQASSTGGAVTNQPTATTSINGFGELSIAKAYAFVEVGGVTPTEAAVGDKILYTYTVTNTGSAPLQDVQIADAHGGNGTVISLTNTDIQGETITTQGLLANSVTGTEDGIITTLAAGAVATFTYEHTVLQREVDEQ